MRPAAFLGLLLLPVLAGADEVFLRGGGHLTGQVVERGEDSIVVDVGAGRIGLPLTAVERIVPGITPLALYKERAARLAPLDVRGWLGLALWAQDQDLPTQARKAFEHVLSLDPSNVTAHRALGHVQLGDRWMTQEDSYKARGYVPFEGSWVMPEERRVVLAERAAAAEEARARAEAEARVREAEARARIAEAEARRAEAESGRAEVATTGIPYAWVGGGGFSPWFGTPWFSSGFRAGLRPGFSHGFHPGLRRCFDPVFPRFRPFFPRSARTVVVKVHRSAPAALKR